MRAERTIPGVSDEGAIVEKAKVAVIGVVDKKPAVLLLRRSPIEDTRIGGDDWPGGTVEPPEMPIDTVLRETGIEVPGLTLHHITELTQQSKRRHGQRIITHLFAAAGEFPPGEIQVSDEHDCGEQVLLEELPDRNMPQKYRDALTSPQGMLVVRSLVLLAQHEAPQHLV